MKKSSFLEGAMIATVAIVIVKIIGLLYVIPFYSIVGIKGSILYSYAYSIYAIFLSLSSSGIPIAISKLVSEYNTLGLYHTKERAYKIGSSIIIVTGLISFLLLFTFAPNIAKMILGDLKGGNTVEEVSTVIRIVSSALLIVPLLSVTKGYLQGHKYIYPSSISSIIEQLMRVGIILVGSYITIRVLHLPVETGVGISVFGATIGALAAYLYLLFKIKKNQNNLKKDTNITRNDARITTKMILKKIIFYALPFILIDIMKSAFTMVDTLTVVSTMVKLGFSEFAELTIGVIDNWGTKLNMIIISISLGITVSLIPNIASSYIKKDFIDISKKTHQTLQTILFIGLPMTLGLYFLASPTWVIFYSYEEVSIAIFKLYVFQALSLSFYSILINIYQTMNDVKVALGTLFISLMFKIFLNIPFMKLCVFLNIEPYYGPVILTLLIHTISIIILIRIFVKKYKFNYKNSLPNYIKIILCSLIMLIVLKIANLIIPLDATTKMGAIKEFTIFAVIGALVYIGLVFNTKIIYDVFGKNFVNNILKKLRLKK